MPTEGHSVGGGDAGPAAAGLSQADPAAGEGMTGAGPVYNRTVMSPGDTLPMLERKPLLLLMDGHAMVHRAWHALQQPLNVSRTGEEVRGVYGFLNTFLRTLADWSPTHCAISFDLAKPTFRHRQYDEYKAQRPPTPPELRAQFPHVRRMMEAFGVPIFEEEGFEADDVLGTLCRLAEGLEIETLVLTGDTDELQLVSPLVRVLLTSSVQQKTVYDVTKVKERYGGLGPDVVPDIKALQGDTSDNIPGVPGVGTKTAIRLLNEYGSIEGVYENLDMVSPPRIQQNLRESRELAHHGKFLTTIVRDVPIQFELEKSRFWTYDRSRVVEILSELEFFSVVSRVPDPAAEVATAVQAELPMVAEPVRETTYEVVDTVEALDALVQELGSPEGFSFATETTSADPMDTKLVGLSFSNAPGRGWYLPVGHADGRQVPVETALDKLRPLFGSDAVPKATHNANYHMTVLANNDVPVGSLALDTMIAAHICGRNALELKPLALQSLGIEMGEVSALIGTGQKRITMAQVPIEQATEHAATKADVTEQLRRVLSEEVEKKGGRDVLENVELPLLPVLVRVQVSGVFLDVRVLERMSEELGGQISTIETEMYELVGHEFNINSSQQLGEVLFQELRLPHTKRTQKGYSTDASSLEAIRQMIDRGEDEDVDPKALQVLGKVLEYRQLTKIKSTYVDALPGLVNPRTGRIHTRYNQTGSSTGRVSSNDPNVQNIPVRTELGRRVRKAFVAEKRPDWTLLAADYSQIELRILAHLSKDPGLIEAFHSGLDIHAATASSVYGVAVDEVTTDMRRIAKIMNFGVVYGLSPFGISQQTGLSRDDGRAFIDTYFGTYPGIHEYIESVKAQVRSSGYVETLMGRRRYIPEARSSNFNVRAAGDRMAINMPIQGTAADILKIAMVRIQERLDALGVRSLMIVQVHDELIFEVPRDELDRMKQVVLELMPAALELAVPLDVELKSGYTWGDME